MIWRLALAAAWSWEASCAATTPPTRTRRNILPHGACQSTTDGDLPAVRRQRRREAAVNDNATLSYETPPRIPTPDHHQRLQRRHGCERYTVSYFRSDGRNAEGVDVPYAFQGLWRGIVRRAASGRGPDPGPAPGQGGAPLGQPPVGGGGADVITIFAEITLYGVDDPGEVVSAQVNVSSTSPTSPTLELASSEP